MNFTISGGRKLRHPWITVLLAMAVFGLLGQADARKHRSKKKKGDDTEEKVDAPAKSDAGAKDGEAKAPAGPPPAVSAADYPAAVKKVEEAYRQSPGPESLYQLGMLADGQGKVLEAQDFLRRYLADPTIEANAPGRADAEKVLAKTRPPSGEVQILADQNGTVLLDGRLVGSLPLSAPLLVSPGKHLVSLEMRDRTMKGQLKAVEGRGMEMNFSRSSGAVVVTLPTAVVVVPQYKGPPAPAEAQRKLQQAAEQGITQGRLATFSKEVAMQRAPKVEGCLDTIDCQAQLAGESDVDYVLMVQVDHTVVMPPPPPPPAPGAKAPPPPPPATPIKESWAMKLSLVDADTVDVAVAESPSCPGCNMDQLIGLVPELVRKMVKEAQAKPRGSWNITSEPAGATIRVGTRVLGNTPLSRPAFAGSYELVFEKPQFQKETKQVEVQAGQKAEVAVTLNAEVAKAPPPKVVEKKPYEKPRARPIWRLVTGSLLLGVGVGMVGFGISALAVNGTCVKPADSPSLQCFDLFTTGTVGGALVGVGAAAIVGGTLMIAIPNKVKPEPPATALLPPTGGLGLALTY